MFNKLNLANMVLDSVSRSINIEPGHCSRIKHKNSGCSVCEVNCPAGAIKVGGPGMTIELDWNKCTGCGICVNLCPTQVFTLRNNGYKDFMDNCCQNIRADGSLEIGCKEASFIRGSAFASVECLGILNVVDFLVLYLRGARKIILKYGDCIECESKHGEKILSENVIKLQELSGIFEDLNSLMIEKRERETIIIFPKQLPILRPKKAEKANPVVDRRGLFNFITNNIKDVAFKSASYMTVQKLEPRTVVNFEVFQTERRTMFLKAIMSLGKLTSETAPTGELFNAIDISPLCIYCGMCVKFCGPKALTIDEDRTQIHFNASKCVSCGLCEKACYHDRLKYKDVVLLKDFFTDVLLIDKNDVNKPDNL